MAGGVVKLIFMLGLLAGGGTIFINESGAVSSDPPLTKNEARI